METITVTEDAVREFVKEALYSMHLGDLTSPEPEEEPPVIVNPVVDQSAAETDPMNVHFVPQNKPEFDVALRNLLKDVPVEKVPGIYKIVTKAIDIDNDKTEEDEQMKKASEGGTSKVKEAIRNEVRKMLSEISPSHFDYGFSGYEHGEENDDDDDQPQRKKINVVGDVGGSTFEEIAKDLGFSVAGAKQAVDKAILKMRFLMEMEPEEREIIVLNAMNDYVRMLTKSGELTPADVQLLKDHPDMVRELDGFREFLGNVVRRARKGAVKLDNPLGTEPTDPGPGEASDVAPMPEPGPKPVAAPKAPREPKEPKGPKAAYKIYGRNGPTPVHTRIKGRVFRPTGVSQFKNSDRAEVGFDDQDTISVKNTETGHTQKWKGESFDRLIDKIISEGKSIAD